MPDQSIGAGDLRHRVVLLRKSGVARGGGGQSTDVYGTTVGTYYAMVEPLGGREAYNARMLKSELTHRVVMRNAFPIYQNDRLFREATGQTFNIDYVRRLDGLNFYWELYCTEQAATYSPPAAAGT